MIGRQIRRAFKAGRLLKSSPYRRGLRQGVAAAIEHEGMLRNLPISSLIDVGANIGQFSLLARTLRPGLIVHAFEPLPEAAARYETLLGGETGVHLHRFAAGEHAATATIHVSGHADSSSLLPISARQNEIFPGTAEVGSFDVRVARVDDVITDDELADPLMIKLDVQGFELAALKGMPRLLQRARYVYAELSFVELYEKQPLAHEIVAWLAERALRIAGTYNVSYAAGGSAVQADFLFRR